MTSSPSIRMSSPPERVLFLHPACPVDFCGLLWTLFKPYQVHSGHVRQHDVNTCQHTQFTLHPAQPMSSPVASRALLSPKNPETSSPLPRATPRKTTKRGREPRAFHAKTLCFPLNRPGAGSTEERPVARFGWVSVRDRRGGRTRDPSGPWRFCRSKWMACPWAPCSLPAAR